MLARIGSSNNNNRNAGALIYMFIYFVYCVCVFVSDALCRMFIPIDQFRGEFIFPGTLCAVKCLIN